VHAAEQDRPDVAERRLAWRFWRAHLDPRHLVFIDEAGANTKMTRFRGRCPRGHRLVTKVPHGHWKTTTLVAGLRQNGVTAPLVVDGPINGDVFRAYVEQQLVATLRPGDVVIMDNLASHKVSGVREAIEAVGAQLVYLPPYSPDFNPIEQAFAKLKTLLRSAAARTVTQLENTIGLLLDQFSEYECRNYFRHSGYAIH
jgi:transposase